jgi:hypothetical protein
VLDERDHALERLTHEPEAVPVDEEPGRYGARLLQEPAVPTRLAEDPNCASGQLESPQQP